MSDKEDFEKWWGGLPTEYKPNMTQDEKLNMWVWGAWQAALKLERERQDSGEATEAAAEELRIANMRLTSK